MNIKIEKFNKFKYVVRYPNGYKEGEKFPVIVFLHGAGTRGDNIELLVNCPFFDITEKHPDFPFVTIAPQCSRDTWFDMFEQLEEFVLKIVDETFADKSRVYLMGASMGGYAVWQLAMSLPEIFSAIVPICGGGMYWNASKLVNVPVWAFHGKKDPVVYVEESQKMVDCVNKWGGKARLTIYPENEHDSWSDTYKNKEVFDWLLTNINKNDEKITDKFQGANIYG